MKIAVISDVHSNIFALAAVIKDMNKHQIDHIVCTGDLVGYCPFPNQVINLIRELNISTIMGNYDDAVGNELMVCGCDYSDPKDVENSSISLNWTINETKLENKIFLKGLPVSEVMAFEEKAIRFVHGSPRKLNEYLKEGSKEAEEIMADLAEDILVCGHTHKPYCRKYGEKLLVNAGSVGKPETGNPNANYVILNVRGGEVMVETVEVLYDHEKTAKAIEDCGLPKEFAELVRTGAQIY